MNPKVSIIVPVYQVERYIQNTIKSIINQSFKNIEVILVNDGTRDKSIENAHKLLAKSDIKYSIINQQNKGVSAARNEGIRQANGEWVICVDSDDVVSRDFIQILYDSCINNDINLSIGNFQNVDAKRVFKKPPKYHQSIIYSQKEIIKLFSIREIKIISPAMLLKKEFIINNNLFYDEEIKFSEDQHFVWRVLVNIKSCSFNKTQTYNYLTRDNSTMTASGLDKIMTGYYGFQKLGNQISTSENVNVLSFIFPRWILGSLRASAKILNFNDYKMLANRMDYKKNTKGLISFPDMKIKVLYLLMLSNLKGFYIINKKV